ncbi:hypothetical protein ARMGADRAFT_1020701, partial [Armillaria gallica]
MAMPSIDTVPDGDDKNLQRPPHDTQGDTGMSDDPTDNFQPLDINENSTAYSLPQWRKLLCSIFGMQQCGFQVGAYLTESKGNVPFDYEQRFLEDKWYEELSPLVRVWRTYLEECSAFDIEMLEGWRDGLDVLLIFAGLFSAVVTTFIIQTSQNLQVDYGQVTATLLFKLIDVQRTAAN